MQAAQPDYTFRKEINICEKRHIIANGFHEKESNTWQVKDFNSNNGGITLEIIG